jgi:hypothetical protein
MRSYIYEGSGFIPGVEKEVGIAASIDESDESVVIKFDREIGGEFTWHGNNVEMNKRPKYNEIVFRTTDLPIETVDLVWKFNASRIDNSLAGVIVPKPNKLKVSGEKGFVLNKSLDR